MVVQVPHSNGATIDQIAHPVKMSRCPPKYQFTGVKLGEHNEQILAELGLDDATMEALYDDRVFG